MFKTRHSWILVGMTGLLACGLIVGCYGSGEAGSGISVVSNMMGGKSLLKVSMNGVEAKQSTLKKAATGYSAWDVKEPVDSDHPKLSYKLTSPDKMGRITATIINIFQEFQGHYSTQAEFVVTPRDTAPDHLMKENVVYDLGNPPAYLRVIDINGKDVKGVKLVPGMKYQLNLSVKADRSETASINFKTK